MRPPPPAGDRGTDEQARHRRVEHHGGADQAEAGVVPHLGEVVGAGDVRRVVEHDPRARAGAQDETGEQRPETGDPAGHGGQEQAAGGDRARDHGLVGELAALVDGEVGPEGPVEAVVDGAVGAEHSEEGEQHAGHVAVAAEAAPSRVTTGCASGARWIGWVGGSSSGWTCCSVLSSMVASML